jgi:hypothetical protein
MTPGGTVQKTLRLALFDWSNNITAIGGEYNVSLLDDTYASSPAITNSTEINLSAGHYLAQAYSSFTRTTATDNVQFKFYLDGSAVGEIGNTDMYQGRNCDAATAEFSVDSSSLLTLRLAAIEIGTSVPSLDADCRLLLWKVGR